MEERARVRRAFDNSLAWGRVKGRRSVCLDSNIWIDLADERTTEAMRVRHRLVEAVERGDLFCPLYAPLIWELYKQDRESRLRTGALMEQASLNVCLAPRMDIFTWEVHTLAHALLGEPLPPDWRGRLYVPLLGYLCQSFSLEFPDATPSEPAEWTGDLACDRLNRVGLTELLTMRDDEIGEHIKRMEPPPYSDLAKKMRSITGGDKGKVFRLEAESVFESVILPATRHLHPTWIPRFLAALKTLPKDRNGGVMETILVGLPAIRNYVETMAVVSQDPLRADRTNDFIDLELIPVPAAYCDLLVTRDRRIRDILVNRTKIMKNTNCEYIDSLEGLERWLLNSLSL